MTERLSVISYALRITDGGRRGKARRRDCVFYRRHRHRESPSEPAFWKDLRVSAGNSERCVDDLCRCTGAVRKICTTTVPHLY